MEKLMTRVTIYRVRLGIRRIHFRLSISFLNLFKLYGEKIKKFKLQALKLWIFPLIVVPTLASLKRPLSSAQDSV